MRRAVLDAMRPNPVHHAILRGLRYGYHHDALSNLPVGYPEGAGFPDDPGADDQIFHLLRADPVALGFDQPVAPPDEIQVAIGIPPDEIAGVDHALATIEARRRAW